MMILLVVLRACLITIARTAFQPAVLDVRLVRVRSSAKNRFARDVYKLPLAAVRERGRLLVGRKPSLFQLRETAIA